MRIVVFGGNGFIGSAFCARVVREIHKKEGEGGQLSLCVVGRSLSSGLEGSGVEYVCADVCKMTEDDFFRLLQGADCVVDCVGVLEAGSPAQEIIVNASWLNVMLPVAITCGVSRVLYVSAAGVSESSALSSSYMRSRLMAESIVARSGKHGMEYFVLRPSFVYGKSCHGGSAAFRYLAGSFGFVFLPPGDGALFAPVALEDLAEIMWVCASGREKDAVSGVIFVCGPELMKAGDIVARLRKWLGFGKVFHARMPSFVFRALGWAGQRLPLWNLSPGMVRQASGDYTALGGGGVRQSVCGVRMRAMDEYYMENPAGSAERWHARVGFVRPFAYASVIVLWFVSGLVGMLSMDRGCREIEGVVKKRSHQRALVFASCLMDFFFAGSMLSGKPHWKKQIVAVSGYTLFLGFFRPSLWKNLYGPLLKNIPIVSFLFVLLFMEKEN